MLTEFGALVPIHGVDLVAAVKNPGRALIISLHYPYPQNRKISIEKKKLTLSSLSVFKSLGFSHCSVLHADYHGVYRWWIGDWVELKNT